jgi:hypothetical protein
MTTGAAMKFEQRGNDWLLIDENAPEGADVIAVLRSEVELVALSRFCQLYLQAPDRVPEHFTVSHKGADFTVTPLGAPGEKLALVIRGDGFSSTIPTEFAVTGN